MVRRNSNRNTPGSKSAWDRHRYLIKWRSFLMATMAGRFEWKNLPDTVDERYLERTLTLQNQAVFFLLDGELRATQVATQSPPDIYGNYTTYTAIGANGQSFEITPGEGVVAWDNNTRFPIWPTVELFAEELASLNEKQQANRRQQNNTVVFSGPAEMREDMTRMVRNMEMNDSQVVVTDKFKENVSIEAIQTGIEYKQREFHEDFTALLNQAYLFLGIDHIQFEKQAHMIETEAEKGTDAVLRNRENFLSARRTAAEECNKLFGTNIEVCWKTPSDSTVKEEELGEEDGY